MNVKPTHNYFEENGIIAIRADKGVSQTSNQIDDLLEELGNRTRAIPFYAFYPPGGGEPQVLDGLITSQTVIDTFDKLVKSNPETEAETTVSEAEENQSTSGTKKVATRN